LKINKGLESVILENRRFHNYLCNNFTNDNILKEKIKIFGKKNEIQFLRLQEEMSTFDYANIDNQMVNYMYNAIQIHKKILIENKIDKSMLHQDNTWIEYINFINNYTIAYKEYIKKYLNKEIKNIYSNDYIEDINITEGLKIERINNLNKDRQITAIKTHLNMTIDNGEKTIYSPLTHSDSINVHLRNKIEKIEVILDNKKVIVSGDRFYGKKAEIPSIESVLYNGKINKQFVSRNGYEIDNLFIVQSNKIHKEESLLNSCEDASNCLPSWINIKNTLESNKINSNNLNNVVEILLENEVKVKVHYEEDIYEYIDVAKQVLQQWTNYFFKIH
jgi:hypothetical protein